MIWPTAHNLYIKYLNLLFATKNDKRKKENTILNQWDLFTASEKMFIAYNSVIYWLKFKLLESFSLEFLAMRTSCINFM